MNTKSKLWIKLCKDGEIIWEKTYGSPFDDLVYTVHQTRNGNFILSGYRTPNRYDYDGCIMKIDKKGNVLKR
ncbi:MAG: hypothetical protein ABIL13_01855 [candidate division WOR-3 bacterium]|jgi:hypothetical protein